MRIKKDGSGGYIDRDTGRSLLPSEYSDYIAKQRAYGLKAHEGRVAAPKNPPAILPKKDGAGGYVDRRTGRQLDKAEYMPYISQQRAYGQIGANKHNIRQSLKTIQEDYGISAKEAKERYARFVAACDRYGRDSKGRYKADFTEYMYEDKK